MEIWVVIPNTENMYEVSSQGQVRSWYNNRWGRASMPHILTPGRAKAGYLTVSLHLLGQKYSVTVHQLVAHAFLGEQPEGTEIAHLNGKRADNRAKNLKYATRSENNLMKSEHGTQLCGERTHMAKLTEQMVRTARWLYSHQVPIVVIADRAGVSRATISDAIHLRTWKHVF